ncbi:MAG: hypothetical protein Q4P15_10695 [Propionibacteriaceae bacterium]|nr:hypothetical protein [Propionibacteriaceae bacterium]
MRRLIAVAAFFVALVSVLVCVQTVQSDQYNAPLGASASFDLRLGQSALSKDAIVTELTGLADEYDTLLLKGSTDADHHESERNLFYFSTSEPHVQGLSPQVDEQGNITWLVGGLKGRLAPASELGNTPLGGIYYVEHVSGFADALAQWAADNGLQVTYQEPQGVLAAVYETLTRSGLSLSWIGANLLVAAFVLSWVFLRHRTRSIQLIGGVAPHEIHREAVVKTGSAAAAGYTLGALVCLAYVWVRHSLGDLLLVLRGSLILVAASFAIMLAVALVVSFVLAPSARAVAFRTVPVHGYQRINALVRGLAVMLAALVLPSALTYAHMAQRSYQQSADMERLGQQVSVSIKDFTYLDSDEGERAATAFFADPNVSQNMTLSVDVGSVIKLNPDELADYSEIDVVDKRYLTVLGVDSDRLTSVEKGQLPEATQTFIDEQVELWIRPGADASQQVRLYEYAPTKEAPFISLGQNAARGGDLKHAENPLLIVVDDPANTMTVSGFLMPLMSNGNVLFTDSTQVEAALREHGLYDSVLSIDRIADASLTTGQQFWSQFTLYLVAALLILATVAVTAWQSAEIWAAAHRKKIFILKTAGVRLRSAYQSVLTGDMTRSAIFYVIGAALSFLMPQQGGPVFIVAAFALTVIVYGLVATVCYHLTTRREFARIARRGA